MNSYILKKDLPDICCSKGDEVELAYWNRDGDAIIHPVGEPGMQSSACVDPDEFLESYSDAKALARCPSCGVEVPPLGHKDGECYCGYRFKDVTKYQLTLNTEQVNVLINALDVFSRIGMGQLEIVAECLRDQYNYTIPQDKLQCVQLCLDAAKVALGHSESGCYGICSPETPKCSKVAYDIQCVIRQVVAKEECHGTHSVWHGNPLHTLKDVPLCEAKVVHKE